MWVDKCIEEGYKWLTDNKVFWSVNTVKWTIQRVSKGCEMKVKGEIFIKVNVQKVN